MTIDVIDVALHAPAFPVTYTGPGTLLGNPFYSTNPDLLTGYFTSDGNVVSIPLGFAPQEIEIINETDGIVWQWNRGMSATHTLKSIVAGASSLDATSAIAVTTFDGRSTITLSAALAASAKNIIYKILG